MAKRAAVDVVMQLLEQRRIPDLKFQSASDEVVAGYELESSGNRAHGKNVYISTSAAPNIKRETLLTGSVLRVGARERLARGELRCERAGADVTVAVYDPRGKAITRVLVCAQCSEDEIDEGLFTWLGPKELYCTPWSDNDPAYCQVVTVARLRQWASR